jgi:CRP-like cAMP-binding protein/ABC-type transporter Mla MlaB component
LAEVRELQGELTFLAMESAIRDLTSGSRLAHWTVLDLTRVDRCESGALRLLADLARQLRSTERDLLLSGVAGHRPAVDDLEAMVAATGVKPIRTFADADLAREWCEDQILELARADSADGRAAQPGDHELLRGLDDKGLAIVQRALRRQSFVPGTLVVRRGDAADRMFLIESGRLSVTIDTHDGATKRLSTLSDGMIFGELALIGREARTADVRADTMVECRVLDLEAFDRLTVEEPAVACTLLTNLLRVVGRTARRMTAEVALLAG